MHTHPLDRFVNSVPWLVPSLGLIIFSQSISFGWPSALQPVFASHVQAVCVFLAGFAIVILGGFMRVTNARVSRLEDELARLKQEPKAPDAV